MPNKEKDLALEKLKGDPNIWMRLTMLSEDGKTMKSVFTDKENPFIKNSDGAMDKIRSLADEGRLYLREEGRSRHFHAVNKDGDSLKLGDQREMKMERTASGTGAAILMWLSKNYFKWIGLDALSKWLGFNGISNWFEKKLQDRRDAIEVDDRYSKEYKAMSDREKKELNAIRKHEKIMKKLEKIQKEAELSEQTLKDLRGQQAPTTTQQAPTTTQQTPTTTQQIPTPPQQQIPTPPQLQSPLLQPPEIKPNENTMQPTLMGDVPVQQIPPAPPLPNQFAAQQIPPAPPLPNQFVAKQKKQQEIPGAKKEENQQGENTRDNKITINGVELTDETINLFPPHVVEAFRVIQQMILEQEAAQRGNQQEQAPVQPEANREEQAALTDVEQPAQLQGEDDPEMNQNQPVNIPNIEEPEIPQEELEINQNQPEDVYLTVNTSNVEEPEMTQEEPEINQNQVEDVPRPVNIPNMEEREMTQEELERMFDHIEEPEMTQEELERMFEGTDAPTMDGTLPTQEIDAPLVHGADLEPDQVNMQQRHEDQAQMSLQARLAAEKEAMDSVANWKDRLANTLFSNEDVRTAKEYYEMIKDGPDGPNLLAGTVCGLLSAAGDPETKKQIMEGLLSGKPLGNEHNSRINESVAAYNHAVEQMSQGNREPMTKLITNAALELGKQASQETSLSPRHVMIGRMISNAMDLADNNKLSLNLDKDQWTIIRGAFQLSKLAQMHHNAKQLLGNENADLTSKQGRNAMRDLLMGNAVENMIRIDKTYGQEITNTQLLMGRDYMTVDNLTKMMSATTIRKSITGEQVKNILEMPDSYNSAKMAKELSTELIEIAQKGYDEYEKSKQLDMQKVNEPENQQQLASAQLQQAM